MQNIIRGWGDKKLALHQYDKLLKIYPNDGWYLYRKGDVLLDLGEEKKGIPLMRQGSKLLKERGTEVFAERTIKYYLESHGKKYIPPDQE